MPAFLIMPVDYLRTLTATERSRRSNVHLGIFLTFNAGAINAGGFLAVDEYTSHMTGVVSTMADELALGQIDLALGALTSLIAFVIGAATSAIMINWARRRQSPHEYSMPLLLEAGLLLAFGLLGEYHHAIGTSVALTIAVLSFLMGLQNAMITKVSNAEIRTTHVTGLMTDIGIELGKLLYWNQSPDTVSKPAVRANFDKLKLHSMLVTTFFLGGVLGALGFKHVGYIATVPPAIALAILSSMTFLPERR
ncbi:YoaK family protein [Aquabacterium sp.]|uniref:YoaK family protein n=1 Tax=Aquabacterium sp. TaxID=1872578 RepID=UPI003B696E4D